MEWSFFGHKSRDLQNIQNHPGILMVIKYFKDL
jgi:hypothetical protein